MYSNFELFSNPSIYVRPTNMVMPLITISKTDIYNFVMNLVSQATNIIRNLVFFVNSLIISVSKEIMKIYSLTELNHDSLFIAIALLCVAGYLFLDTYLFQSPLVNKITELENQINYMKKVERMRDNDWELLMKSQSQGFKQLQVEFNKKYKQYEKQIKKLEKEIDMYN